MNECAHSWIVVEASRFISHYTGLESGIKRCTLCNEECHFTRDVDPDRYPKAVTEHTNR